MSFEIGAKVRVTDNYPTDEDPGYIPEEGELEVRGATGTIKSIGYTGYNVTFDKPVAGMKSALLYTDELALI